MKLPNCAIRQLLAGAAVMVLAGCTTPPRVEVRTVNVPVPVACNEAMPTRPVMPTEALPVDANVDTFVQSAQAEIERREGYEVQLVAALQICTKPTQPAAKIIK